METNIKNIMLIGVGPHARKVYVPWLSKYSKKYHINLKLTIELKSQKEETEQILHQYGFDTENLYIEPLKRRKIDSSLSRFLDKLVKKHQIKAVIIATEPSVHKAFALWALRNELHILMDKPITTNPHSSSNVLAAADILSDYEELCALYYEKKQQKNILFSINVQRRYHSGFEFVLNKLREVAKKTNCPVTSIQSSHGDGQWRLPDEIIDIDYHGYKNGYGKMSHSGYHFFDTITQFIKAGTPKDKLADTVLVSSFLNTPSNYFQQLNIDDYKNIFGNQYKAKYNNAELGEICSDYGELDSFSLMRFLRKDIAMCTVQLSLLHNSLSQRSWLLANKDLYKGNGRVKHEYHCLQQGPFQCIQVHSYQSKDNHDRNTKKEYAVGGNNHFDIHIFRNTDIIGGKKYQKISIDQLLKENLSSQLLTNITKGAVLVEFFEYIQGTESTNLRSDLLDHSLGVTLMSLNYLAAIKNKTIKRKLFKNTGIC